MPTAVITDITATPTARRRQAATPVASTREGGASPRTEELTHSHRRGGRDAPRTDIETILTDARVSNVVPLPRRLTGADAIVAEVTARSKQQEASLLEDIRNLRDALETRHRARAYDLIPIAVKMDRPTLDNFIEIGRRLLAAGEARL